MSAQFGCWTFAGSGASPEYLAKVGQTLCPYGPDARTSYSRGGVDLLYRAFDTTTESRAGIQPHVSESGSVITWDGRLDNRAELVRLLGGVISSDSSDVSIVGAAYQRWGTNCFAKLVGDWALGIWNPTDRAVILAKDPIGIRHLYYHLDSNRAVWSTILDPLVLFSEKSVNIEEEYVAGWLSHFPATHLTPHAGIRAVPASSFVLLKSTSHKVLKYWDFDPSVKIRYRSDAEYEEHFRTVFTESVRRRLRSDTPILAELSGGVDSSSIVCMADSIIGRGDALAPRLDTVSYYDDSEPNWNERPYFTIVERKRGRTGCHIDVASARASSFGFESDRFRATPASSVGPPEVTRQLQACVMSQGNRVVLSGIGGDEFTGGLPTPAPELADLLARGHLRTLAHQLKLWALDKRKPWFHLLGETVRRFLPPGFASVPELRRPAPWLAADFVKRHLAALTGYEPRLKLFGPLPSFQEHLSTLDALRRQLSCTTVPSEPLLEKRYPYLDRDLLAFLCAIPREQLVRPGQRRSLTRRALAGIVPDALLNRKRKAFVARSPRLAISEQWESLAEMGRQMVTAPLGFVASNTFREAMDKARTGQEVLIVPLLRTIEIECWIRDLGRQGILERRAIKIAPGVGGVPRHEHARS
jgi:asparagine synthase (glutamine-hydrolysing)